MGMHSTEREFWQHTLQRIIAAGLHQRAFSGSRHPADNSHAQRNALAQCLRRDASFGFDLDVLGGVVENADADVIEAEILLDLGHDGGQHLLRVLAGDGGLRNVVEERQLARAPLLLGEQAGILHRHRNLAGGGLHDFQIARLENVLALRIHGRHHSGDAARQA